MAKSNEPEKMEHFSPETVDFLWELRFNNRRDWFQENKPRYEAYLNAPMKALAAQVGERFQIEGTRLKTSRIYRDVRYSGGIPYKEHLWFVIWEDREFWSEHPSLYFQIEPEGARIGFGYYAPPAALMALHRKALLENPAPFLSMMERILSPGDLKDGSERYKREKPGCTPEIAPWYQLKRCFIEMWIPAGDELFSPSLADTVVSAFERMKPLYEYFRALEQRLQSQE